MPDSGKRPTIRELAAETGLSPAAVSYALRGIQVSVETQERVREVADRLGYEVPRKAALGRARAEELLANIDQLSDEQVAALLAELGEEKGA